MAIASQATAEQQAIAPRMVAPPIEARRAQHHVAPRDSAAGPPNESAPIQGLSAEIAALDGARHALSAGRASEALALLDAYVKGFPAGTFTQEASVLRVQALHGAGRDREAALIGERLLASNPSGAHAQRLRSLLASLSDGR
jgi:TolA-binding protein